MTESNGNNFIPINKCRVCGNNFFREPLLRYENMPKAAQYLPDAKSLGSDTAVDLEVCQCSGCGLVQLNNHPVPYYREVIRASSVSEEMKDFRKKQFALLAEKYLLKKKKSSKSAVVLENSSPLCSNLLKKLTDWNIQKTQWHNA
jgi:hypothetical protein